jgi:REP element-mobilizing transposase RayT
VRRAFLCGIDAYTGQSFEHRKGWVETRIRLVGECFQVAIHAYAIMGNHLHLVLQIDPWEGRYNCQMLCDDRAVLAAMT